MSDDSDNPYAFTSEEPLAELVDDSVDRLAPRMTRLGAVIVDGLLCAAILLPFQIISGFMSLTMNEEQSVMQEVAMAFIGILVYVALNGYLLSSRGQTIGKVLTGIQAVDFETGRLMPFYRVYIYRDLWFTPIQILSIFLGEAGNSIFSLVGLIDAIWIFGAQQRCLHDLIAGSKVVYYRANRKRMS